MWERLKTKEWGGRGKKPLYINTKSLNVSYQQNNLINLTLYFSLLFVFLTFTPITLALWPPFHAVPLLTTGILGVIRIRVRPNRATWGTCSVVSAQQALQTQQQITSFLYIILLIKIKWFHFSQCVILSNLIWNPPQYTDTPIDSVIFGCVPMFPHFCGRLNFKKHPPPLPARTWLTSALTPTPLPLITLITSNYMTLLMPARRPVFFFAPYDSEDLDRKTARFPYRLMSWR